jgi:hypothetical protein
LVNFWSMIFGQFLVNFWSMIFGQFLVNDFWG